MDSKDVLIIREPNQSGNDQEFAHIISINVLWLELGRMAQLSCKENKEMHSFVEEPWSRGGGPGREKERNRGRTMDHVDTGHWGQGGSDCYDELCHRSFECDYCSLLSTKWICNSFPRKKLNSAISYGIWMTTKESWVGAKFFPSCLVMALYGPVSFNWKKNYSSVSISPHRLNAWCATKRRKLHLNLVFRTQRIKPIVNVYHRERLTKSPYLSNWINSLFSI